MPNKDYVKGIMANPNLDMRTRHALALLGRTTETRDAIAGPRVRIRFSVSGSTVTVLSQKNVFSIRRSSAGTYTLTASYVWPANQTFQAQGEALFDEMQQIARTANSVTFQTTSGRDAAFVEITMETVDIFDTGSDTAGIVLGAWIMGFGEIDAHNVGDDAFTPSSPSAGTILPTGSPLLSGNYTAALAYADAGTTNNVKSITFTYRAESSGSSVPTIAGVAIGVRWSQSGTVGVIAFITSDTPKLNIYEMRTAPWSVQQSTTTNLSLTAGNSYTLTLTDTGTTVTASITDDGGAKTAALTTSFNTSNSQIVYGWIAYQGASNPGFNYVFASTISTTPSV